MRSLNQQIRDYGLTASSQDQLKLLSSYQFGDVDAQSRAMALDPLPQPRARRRAKRRRADARPPIARLRLRAHWRVIAHDAVR